MAKIASTFKAKLSEILRINYRKLGKVALARPYKDDDGGEGGQGLQLLEHPWLSQMPIGVADSSLDSNAQHNPDAEDNAMNRANELTNSLQMQPAVQNALRRGFDPQLRKG